MIFPVMIFCLLSHTNTLYRNGVRLNSFHKAKYRPSETRGNQSYNFPPRHQPLKVHNEVQTVKHSLGKDANYENISEQISAEKLPPEKLSSQFYLPDASNHFRIVKVKKNFTYIGKPPQQQLVSERFWNRSGSPPVNVTQAPRRGQTRQKRSVLPCLPPQLTLYTSGETKTTTERGIYVHVFAPSLPITVTSVAVFCCISMKTYNLNLTVSSSEIDIRSTSQWHDLEVDLLFSYLLLQQTNTLQINGFQGRTKTNEITSVGYDDLVRLDVSITGDGVRWYAGPKKPDCSWYSTNTRPAPATTTKGIDWMSQHESAQKMNIILGSVLGLLVTVLVILGIVIMRMRKKGRLAQDGHVQKPRDASRPLQNCPAPRQVDQTTFSVAPTATISPLTVTRAGGDAEVEYYEPPECFPIDSTSAAYVIFDDDGNPIN